MAKPAEEIEPVDKFIDDREPERHDTEFNAARREVARRTKMEDRRKITPWVYRF